MQETSEIENQVDPAAIAREHQRPQIVDYELPGDFARDMLTFRRKTEPGFSVQIATRALRRVSPALVSLVLANKRKLTLDRADEFAKLLNLNPGERYYLRTWILRSEQSEKNSDRNLTGSGSLSGSANSNAHRKDVSPHIFTDWLNLYVKDLFQFTAVQKEPARISAILNAIAKPNRVRRSLDFLLREGHLRRTMQGEIVTETQLSITEGQISSQKVRRFHKNALGIAKDAIDLYSSNERFTNTLIIPLSSDDYQELMALTTEFSERLKIFAESRKDAPERLYQFIVNLSPIGGKIV